MRNCAALTPLSRAVLPRKKRGRAGDRPHIVQRGRHLGRQPTKAVWKSLLIFGSAVVAGQVLQQRSITGAQRQHPPGHLTVVADLDDRPRKASRAATDGRGDRRCAGHVPPSPSEPRPDTSSVIASQLLSFVAVHWPSSISVDRREH